MSPGMRDPVVQRIVTGRVHWMFEDRARGEELTRLIVTRTSNLPHPFVVDGELLLFDDCSVAAMSQDDLNKELVAALARQVKRASLLASSVGSGIRDAGR